MAGHVPGIDGENELTELVVSGREVRLWTKMVCTAGTLPRSPLPSVSLGHSSSPYVCFPFLLLEMRMVFGEGKGLTP